MKKKYNAPKAQLMTLHAQSPMLTVSGGDTGIGSGGDASKNEGGLPDPEAKSQNAWNTWEEW